MGGQRAMGAGEWGLLAGLSALWGGSFFFSKLARTGLIGLGLAAIDRRLLTPRRVHLVRKELKP